MTSHVLERRRRLSRSLLWKLQRAWFDGEGIRAWNENVVPHYVTSNPWIASACAKVVFGWLRDVEASLDRAAPLVIAELGCGSGRFGYLFLRRLLEMLERSRFRDLRIRYVFTDFTEYNLDILRSHPALQELVGDGVVDFARFDVETSRELHLSHSGEVLTSATMCNPMVVFANYVFDGTPMDCFSVVDGALHESLVTLSVPDEEPDLDDPTLIERLTVDYDHVPVAGGGHYENPAWNRILDGYTHGLCDSSLLFPSAALSCIDRLRALANDRLLLLSADKGEVDEQSLHGRALPRPVVHGSFSFGVNFHAIGSYVSGEGGEMLVTSHRGTSLNVVACLFGGDAPETRLAFEENIERRGPDDFFSWRQNRPYDAMSLSDLIGVIRFSGWYHTIFLHCFSALLMVATNATPLMQEKLRELARNVWHVYFPSREPYDVALHLGLLLCQTWWLDDALTFFERSESLYGPTPESAMSMASCAMNLGRPEQALHHCERALELAPDLEPALELRAVIAAGDR